ncbi:hypothetical protein [Sutcliffiella cohnii]|uniref:hypothetical protein n=1 Tax=Sutcliffiella cohnii TaxID=33932 RepID=UPI002E1F131E|nr:hypothetical protein [Sutcliffiella cohnii]
MFENFSDAAITNFGLIYGLICIVVPAIYLINLRFYAKLVYNNPSEFTGENLDKEVKKTLLKKYGNKMDYTHSHIFQDNPLVYKRLQRIY